LINHLIENKFSPFLLYISLSQINFTFKSTIMRSTIKLMILVLAIACSTASFAQTRSYKEGSVWSVSIIKSETGQTVAYLNSLKTTWKGIMDEAKAQGLILSYKILSGQAANPADFDIMLLVEYKDMAAMDGNDDKWDAISAKVVGNDDVQGKLRDTRVKMRTIYGGKLLREIVYK
jgi:hypothetical protein